MWKREMADVMCVKHLMSPTGNPLITLKPSSAEGGAAYVELTSLIAAAPELRASLVELTDWLREHTGPSDGIHNALVRAVELLNQIPGR